MPEYYKKVLLEGKESTEETEKDKLKASEATLQNLRLEYGNFRTQVKSFLKGSLGDWGAYADGIIGHFQRAMKRAADIIRTNLPNPQGGFTQAPLLPAGMGGAFRQPVSARAGVEGYDIKPAVTINQEHTWNVKTEFDYQELFRRMDRHVKVQAGKTRQGIS
jgi:hypothetical protein